MQGFLGNMGKIKVFFSFRWRQRLVAAAVSVHGRPSEEGPGEEERGRPEITIKTYKIV